MDRRKPDEIGQSETMTLDTTRGRDYLVIAVCDNDCEDLDLCIYDGQGNRVSCDTETDSNPVLQWRASYSGRYQVKVSMYDCNANPCYYALGYYRR